MSRLGAFVPSVHDFDPAAFGLGDGEAALMDPQQRLLLEETLAALVDAGRQVCPLQTYTVAVPT